MDSLDIHPNTHTIVYRKVESHGGYEVACPLSRTSHARYYWHIAIMNSDGKIEISKENLLWEEAEHYMILWNEQHHLPIYQVKA